MKITAALVNGEGRHHVTVRTNDSVQNLSLPSGPTGFGSRVNGGELLFLALATCYCNDLYREAAERDLEIEQVDVEVEGEFGAEGEPARNVSYRAKVTAHASEAEIHELMERTDRVAEIQATLRLAIPVVLSGIEAVTV